MKSLQERYSETLLSRLEAIKRLMPRIRKAGEMLVEAKIAGGRLLVYDRGFAMSLDCWTRGSGLYDIHIYRRSQKQFRDGDMLILGSYAADDPDDIAVARELRSRANTRLVTISPHDRKGNRRGNVPLHTLADVALDNGCGDSGGLFEVRGVEGPALPIAREVNFTINWAVQCEYIQGMIDRGRPPTLFYLVHFPLFKEMDQVMRKRMGTYGY
ncbi:MAG: hypothetical protein ACYC9O_04400 [Candidatus Latescibacterota bacterium]